MREEPGRAELVPADRLVEGVQVGEAETAGRAEGGAVVFQVTQPPAGVTVLTVTVLTVTVRAAGGQGARDRGAAEGGGLLGPAAGDGGLQVRPGVPAVRGGQP